MKGVNKWSKALKKVNILKKRNGNGNGNYECKEDERLRCNTLGHKQINLQHPQRVKRRIVRTK